MEAVNATAEVNAFRERKWLDPFIEDPCLVEAAKAIALRRAQQRIKGHTSNDFNGLEPGCKADAAGCAALEPDWGWHSCCDSEPWKYGGAAVVIGDDGLRYMQLFVREETGGARQWGVRGASDAARHHPADTLCVGETGRWME